MSKTKAKPKTAPQQETGGDCNPRIVQRWGRLRFGNIVGVVDSYGAVHSEFTGEKVAFHAEHFPAHHCQWRWNHSQSIWWITAEHKPTEEQYEAITNHLTRKYGLKWWENGHHDIDHLQAKWAEEDSSLNDERVHHYQRGRASITGLGLKFGKIIETERLVGIVTARLVLRSSFVGARRGISSGTREVD